eukprot:5126288-Amphidinium_carterae.1
MEREAALAINRMRAISADLIEGGRVIACCKAVRGSTWPHTWAIQDAAEHHWMMQLCSAEEPGPGL